MACTRRGVMPSSLDRLRRRRGCTENMTTPDSRAEGERERTMQSTEEQKTGSTLHQLRLEQLQIGQSARARSLWSVEGHRTLRGCRRRSGPRADHQDNLWDSTATGNRTPRRHPSRTRTPISSHLHPEPANDNEPRVVTVEATTALTRRNQYVPATYDAHAVRCRF